jgi:hypothetical protein
MRTLTVGLLAPFLFLAFAQAAVAQDAGSVELGYDMSFEMWFIDDVDDNLISVSVPGGGLTLLSPQAVRIGYLFSEAGELEFPLGFSYLDDDGDAYWLLGTGVYGLYNIRKPGSTTIPYLRGGGSVSVISAGDETLSQFSLGAGVGARSLVADRLAIRYGIGVERSFETEDLRGHTDLLFSLGLSFFTPGRTAP